MLSIWRDRFVFTSPRFLAQPTSSRPAITIHVATEGELQVSSGADSFVGRVLVVGPNIKRTFHGVDGGLYTLHLEPVYSGFRHLRAGMLSGKTVVDLSDRLEASTFALLDTEVHQAQSCADRYRTSQKVVDALFPEVRGAQPIDVRVDLVASWLFAHAPVRMDLAFLSELCGLSSGHLEHLFTETMGISIRQYLLWIKMRKAAEMFVNDVALAEVAHAIGFSDSAHLSRTFRRYFALTPSFVSNRKLVRLQLCDGASG